MYLVLGENMLKKIYLFRIFIILVLIYFLFYFFFAYPFRLSIMFMPLEEITDADKIRYYAVLSFYRIISLPSILILITYFVMSFLLNKINNNIISKIQLISIIALVIDSIALVIGSIIFEHLGASTIYKMDMINAVFNIVLATTLIMFSIVFYSKYNLKESMNNEKN